MERKHEYQTKSRQMILDYLIRNKDRAVHVSDIIRHMDQEECSVNKTTVYRYLDKLVAEKTLMKYVADKGEKAVFQYVDEGRHCREHLHLKCVDCGRLIHLDEGVSDALQSDLLRAAGFTVDGRSTTIYGTCAACGRKRDGHA